MPAKKEAAHDCKAECADLYKQLAALKKEIAALKAELKKAPKGGGGADPRVDKLIEALKLKEAHDTPKKERLELFKRSVEIIKSL